MFKILQAFIILTLLLILFNSSQGDCQQFEKLHTKYISKVTSKIKRTTKAQDKASVKYLNTFNKSVESFINNLSEIDSRKADAFCAQWNYSKSRLFNKLNHSIFSGTDINTIIYNSYNDTLLNSIQCVGDVNAKLAASLFLEQGQKQVAIQEYMRSQKLFLKRITTETGGLNKSYKAVDKDVYYYSQKMNELQNRFENKSDIENIFIQLLNNLMVFDQFLKINSFSSKLGNIPADWGKSLAKLQTSSNIKLIQQQYFSTLNNEGIETIKKQATEGAEEINKIKSNYITLNNAGDIPEFNPNPLKVKRLFDRMNIGFDLQFKNHLKYIPQNVTIGINLEYQYIKWGFCGIGTNYPFDFKINKTEKELKNQKRIVYSAFNDVQIKSSVYCTTLFEYFQHNSNSSNIPTYRTMYNIVFGIKLRNVIKTYFFPSLSLVTEVFHHSTVAKQPILQYKLSWMY